MLGRPAPLGSAAVVVGPDDLVEKTLPAEDAVQQHLAVVRLAVVDVEEERARAGEHPVGLLKARREEGQVVAEVIGIAGGAERGRSVAPTLEAGPVALRGPAPSCSATRFLLPASIEGRIDIDQVDAAVAQRAQELEIVVEDDAQHGAAPSRMAARPRCERWPPRATRPRRAPARYRSRSACGRGARPLPARRRASARGRDR